MNCTRVAVLVVHTVPSQTYVSTSISLCLPSLSSYHRSFLHRHYLNTEEEKMVLDVSPLFDRRHILSARSTVCRLLLVHSRFFRASLPIDLVPVDGLFLL